MNIARWQNLVPLVQVIPVRLELSDGHGLSSSWRWVSSLFLEEPQGPVPGSTNGPRSPPSLRGLCCARKNTSGSSHVYLGQKEGVV